MQYRGKAACFESSDVMSRCRLRALTAYEILITLQDSAPKSVIVEAFQMSAPGCNIVEKQHVSSVRSDLQKNSRIAQNDQGYASDTSHTSP